MYIVPGSHQRFPLGHIHVHRGSDGRAAHGNSGGKNGIHEQHVGLGQHIQVPLSGGQRRAVPDLHFRFRRCHLHAQSAGHGVSAARNRSCRDDGDQILLVLRGERKVSASGGQDRVLSDDCLRDGLVDVHIDPSANRYTAAGGNSSRCGNQQEVGIRLRGYVHTAGGLNTSPFGNGRDCLAVADNDVNAATDGIL